MEVARLMAEVDEIVRQFEVAERNAQALDEWRYHQARGSQFSDATRSPDERALAERRADARSWMARSMFFRRQAG
jgi:hypothetical protein